MSLFYCFQLLQPVNVLSKSTVGIRQPHFSPFLQIIDCKHAAEERNRDTGTSLLPFPIDYMPANMLPKSIVWTQERYFSLSYNRLQPVNMLPKSIIWIQEPHFSPFLQTVACKHAAERLSRDTGASILCFPIDYNIAC